MPLSRTLITVPVAGAITTQTDHYVEGRIQQIYIDYTGVGVGTNLTIDDPVTGIQYLQLLANNADGIWAPRAACTDNTGAAVFYDPAGAPEDVRDCFYAANPVQFTVAGAGGAGTIEVSIYYSDFK